jgi:hypothetical protein
MDQLEEETVLFGVLDRTNTILIRVLTDLTHRTLLPDADKYIYLAGWTPPSDS